jgi:hypothetical protein
MFPSNVIFLTRLFFTVLASFMDANTMKRKLFPHLSVVFSLPLPWRRSPLPNAIS